MGSSIRRARNDFKILKVNIKKTEGINDRIRVGLGRMMISLVLFLGNVYVIRYERVYSSELPINIPPEGKKRQSSEKD